MAAEQWPKPKNQSRYEPSSNPNLNDSYNDSYLEEDVIEPAQPQDDGGFKRKVQDWGTDFAKEQARDYAIGKAVDLAAKIPLAGRVFSFTRWFYIAEWGALGVALLFTVLGIIGLFQHETFLAVFILILAALAFGIFWVIRKVRLFVERQIARAFNKFQELVRRGVERPDDWPNWYRRNKARV